MNESITTLSGLLTELSGAPSADLVFVAQGEVIQPDYHVTELKFAQLDSIDCGGEQQGWNELLIQLLDGPAAPRPGAEYMKVATFIKLASKAASKQKDQAELYFEYSEAGEAMRKLSVTGVQVRPGQVLVELGPVGAVCKPVLKRQSEPSASACC